MASKHPDSLTRLTEFAPLSSEMKSKGFFSRLFKRNPETSEQSKEKSPEPEEVPSSVGGSPEASESDIRSREESPVSDASGDDTVNTSGGVEAVPTRTLTNVLRRLGNILDRRSQTPQAYKDSDFKQYWMPDSNCKECYECSDRFNTFRRRHHCRICGQIFCSRCCNQEVPGKIMGYTGYLRVCTYCCKVVLSYAQNPDLQSGDLNTLCEDLQQQLVSSEPPDGSTWTPGTADSLWTPNSKRKGARSLRMSTIFDEDSKQRLTSSTDASNPNNSFDVTPQTEYPSSQGLQGSHKFILKDSSQLRELWALMQDAEQGVEFQSHRHRLRTHPNCVVGSQVVDWLTARDKVLTREQAVTIGQALVDASCLICVTCQEQVFCDEYALFKPGEAFDIEPPLEANLDVEPGIEVDDDAAEPLWLKEIKRDEEADNNRDLAELTKIPSTVSVPEDLDMTSRSVFYVDTPQGATSILRSGHSRTESSSDRGRESGTIFLPGRQMLHSGSEAVEPLFDKETPHTDPYGDSKWVCVDEQGGWKESSLGMRDSSDMTLSSSYRSSDTSIPGLRGSNGNLEVASPGGWQQQHEHGEQQAYERLRLAHTDHLMALLQQLLQKEGLSQRWSDVVLTVARRVAHTVQPDIRQEADDMDIRQYVQIKKIPGGTKSQCSITYGVCCSKNVAHKNMRQHIQAPKILLLQAPIEYQRVENKYSSLEPQILQESEFLKNCVARIAAVEPDILLVEKSVSRVAQDYVLDTGISLVINVKPSVMERVSRFTQADVVTSVDGLVNRSALGHCHTFKTQTFSLPDGETKSLMYFDGCPSHLGCTVSLRGGTLSELKKVKKVLHFMIYVAYHSKLEMAFLMDEFALPPAISESKSFHIIEPEQLSPAHKHAASLKEISDSNETIKNSTQTPVCSNALTQGSINIVPTVAEVKNSVKDTKNNDSASGTQNDHSTDTVIVQKTVDTPAPSAVTLEDSVFLSEDDKIVTQSLSEIGIQCRLVETHNNKSLETRAVIDQSDPLQHYQNSQDETIFQRASEPVVAEVRRSLVRQFKRALGEVVLSTSPFIQYDIPYLVTEAGAQCTLRSFFPNDLYWTSVFDEHEDTTTRNDQQRKRALGNEFDRPRHEDCLLPCHPFITEKFTVPVVDPYTQALLADFRARGGRIQMLGSCHKPTNAAVPASSKDTSSPLHWQNRIDCLDPYRHQRLAVLLSSFSYESANAPNPCVNPWVVTMDYYGRNDLTLGSFLERYCFRETYQCPSPSCDTPMVDHIRRFVHHQSGIQVILKRLEVSMPASTTNILMWEWCKRCKKTTPMVPMSPETWSMSFAKYLELRFHDDMYTRRGDADVCLHSLHHDHFQYFGFKNVVASFKFFPISLKEIVLPPMIVHLMVAEIQLEQWAKEQRHICYKGPVMYSNILEHLHRLQHESQTDLHMALLAEYILHLQDDKNKFSHLQDQLQSWMKILRHKMGILQPVDLQKLVWHICDTLVLLRAEIANTVAKWNARIQDVDQQLKKQDKPRSQAVRREVASTPENILEAPLQTSRAFQSSADDTESEPTFVLPSSRGTTTPQLTLCPTPINDNTDADVDEALDINPGHFSSTPNQSAAWGIEGHVTESAPPGGVHESLSSASSKGSHTSGGEMSSYGAQAKSNSTDELEAITHGFDDASLKSHTRSKSLGDSKKILKQGLTRDASSQDLEKKSMKTLISNLLSGTGTAVIQNPLGSDEHYLSVDVSRVPVAVLDQEPSSIIAYTLSSAEYEQQLLELAEQSSTITRTESNSSPALKRADISGKSASTDSLDSAGKKGTSRGLSFFKGSTVREKSPCSYGNQFEEVEAVRYTPRLDRDSVDDIDEPDLSAPLASMIESLTKPSAQQQAANWHIELQFSDSTAKFYCRVYFAEQFHQLRTLILPEGEERFVRSLSRCFTWLARGGKSGSTFCKTQDDRFILKQMSRYEVQSFLEFAPGYFQYVTTASKEQKPTVLAKILGVYRVGFRNSQTNATLKQDLLVMENLFYGRNISQIFDLKGSLRNRLVSTSGKRVEELVLLDENLLKLSVDSPMYIRPHSKTLLTLAITNDTHFLTSHLVMDYSLLVGWDDCTQELVVGIIDYIRTFTWDKKLEMVVKTTYSQLGGQGKMPTVVSPELYRNRFLEAMDRYFLLVPDCWTGLGRDVDC